MKKIFPFMVIILCFVYFFVSVVGYDWSITNISYVHRGLLRDFIGKPLVKGTNVRIKFNSKYDHLGAVLVRFASFYRPKAKDEDRVVFRLFEDPQGILLYENTYRIAYGFENSIFPFGFPAISNSAGKTYTAEMKFLNGSYEDPLFIFNREPAILTRYSFSKSSLLSGGNNILNFLYMKCIVPLNNPDYIYIIWTSILPILLLLMLWGKPKNIKIILKSSAYLMFVFTFIADVVLMQMNSDLLYLWYFATLFIAIKAEIFSVRLVQLLISIFFILGFWFTMKEILPCSRNAVVYLFLTISVLFSSRMLKIISNKL